MSTDQLLQIPIDELELDESNVRSGTADITELAQSIASIGLINPVVVQPANGNGKHRMIAGARRLLAIDYIRANPAKFEGLPHTEWPTVPAIQREVTDDQRVVAQLVENLQREDLSPIDEARGYLALASGAGWRQNDIAAAIGRNKSHISKRLSLLSLPERVIDCVDDGLITVDQALQLVKLADHPDVIEKLVGVDGDVSYHAVTDALAKQERQAAVDKVAKRVAQVTDVPIVRKGFGDKRPKGTFHAVAKTVGETAWDGTVPAHTELVEVSQDYWVAQPVIEFFTTDVAKAAPLDDLPYEQRNREQRKRQDRAEVAEAVANGNSQVDPETLIEREVTRRLANERHQAWERARLTIGKRSSIADLTEMAVMYALELVGEDEDDAVTVAQLCGVEPDWDSDDAGTCDAFFRGYISRSKANERRFVHNVLMTNLDSGWRHSELLRQLIETANTFNEQASRSLLTDVVRHEFEAAEAEAATG